MRAYHLFAVALFVGLSGCSSLGADEEIPLEEQGPYIWSRLEAYDDVHVRTALVTSSNQLLVSSHDGLFMADTPTSHPTRVSAPFTDEPSVLKEFNQQIFAVTEGAQFVMTSTDGYTWTRAVRLHRPIFDVWVDPSETMVLASEFGVYVKYRDQPDLYRDRFLDSALLFDHIVALTQTEDGAFFAGTHDGIYRAAPDGTDWQKVSGSIRKHFDKIVKLVTTQDDQIIAAEEYDLYVSGDSGTSWQAIPGPGHEPNDLAETPDGLLHLATDQGLFLVDLNAESYTATGPITDEGDLGIRSMTFTPASDLVVVTREGVYLGEKNTLSYFWAERE